MGYQSFGAYDFIDAKYEPSTGKVEYKNKEYKERN